jgi:heat-inducible transcriptional repressor
MDVPMPLDERKQKILKAVVADYTETGIPVGSHALALHLASWSSATIRNELSTLVEIGYLLQPHTSAGRVPSDLGYRYYVDFLMEEEQLPIQVRRQMEPLVSDMPLDLEGVLERAASALAISTDGLSLVTGPRAHRVRVKHLDLVSLDPDHALLILVLEGNLIRQQPLDLSRDTDQRELSLLAAQLNGELAGLDAVAMGDLQATDDLHPLRAEILGDIVDFMRSVEERQDMLIVHDGVRNLLHQPEFGDVDRLQQILELLEEERVLGEILATLEQDKGVRIMIGRESGVEQLSQCSLVLTTYRVGEGRGGTIGVLGPTRMRYSQVAPRLRLVAQRVGQALTRVLS